MASSVPTSAMETNMAPMRNQVVTTVHRQESIHLFFTPLTTQIAGHGSEESGDVHTGFLKRQRDGKLLKPLQVGQGHLSFISTIEIRHTHV